MLLGSSDLPPDWNPLAEDYLSERNSYLVDIDDPGVATVGISKSQLIYARFFFTLNRATMKVFLLVGDCPLSVSDCADE